MNHELKIQSMASELTSDKTDGERETKISL